MSRDTSETRSFIDNRAVNNVCDMPPPSGFMNKKQCQDIEQELGAYNQGEPIEDGSSPEVALHRVRKMIYILAMISDSQLTKTDIDTMWQAGLLPNRSPPTESYPRIAAVARKVQKNIKDAGFTKLDFADPDE